MKARRIAVLIFCFVIFFNAGHASADWAPGNTTIQNNIADNKSSTFSLSMDDPIKWEVVSKTLFSMNTFGGWDVGYDYHFNWNFGEGIDVASDGWSYPELMTLSDLDIGARAWLKLIGPGVTLDFWTIDPFNVDILEVLGVNSKIEEEISIPDIQFSLPFLEDN
ncbi:hypothetical protein KA005_42815, partial [bacterium]|nr:hypothetical protein [bacterium]